MHTSYSLLEVPECKKTEVAKGPTIKQRNWLAACMRPRFTTSATRFAKARNCQSEPQSTVPEQETQGRKAPENWWRMSATIFQLLDMVRIKLKQKEKIKSMYKLMRIQHWTRRNGVELEQLQELNGRRLPLLPETLHKVEIENTSEELHRK